MKNRGAFVVGLLVLLVVGFIYIMLRPGGIPEVPAPVVEEPLVPVQEMGAQYVAYLTGYTFYDNTPPGTARIAFSRSYGFPTVHEEAGGTGTFDDPITVAVGHVITEGVSTPDFLPGTKFYIPNVRRYFIVEDTCGDGPTPQLGPCHTLTPDAQQDGAAIWLDLWIGGDKSSDEQAVEACMFALTNTHRVIKDPLPGYVVEVGPLFAEGECAQQYGDRAILQI